MDKIKIVDFGRAPFAPKAHVGQVRRWAFPHDHSANGLVFKITGFRDDGKWMDGIYLKDDPRASHRTPVDIVGANVGTVLADSELLEEAPGLLLTVNVSQKDIDEGKCGNPYTCAVARGVERAVKKRFRRWKEVRVGQGGIAGYVYNGGVSDKNLKFQYEVPARVSQFIAAFDGGDDHRAALKPMTFKIAIPERFVGKRR
jgi:hypothetical protein